MADKSNQNKNETWWNNDWAKTWSEASEKGFEQMKQSTGVFEEFEKEMTSLIKNNLEKQMKLQSEFRKAAMKVTEESLEYFKNMKKD